MSIDELKAEAQKLGHVLMEKDQLVNLIKERNELRQDITDAIGTIEFFLNETGIKEFGRKKAEKAEKNGGDISIGMGDIASILPVINKVPKVLANPTVQGVMKTLMEKYGNTKALTELID